MSANLGAGLQTCVFSSAVFFCFFFLAHITKVVRNSGGVGNTGGSGGAGPRGIKGGSGTSVIA